MNVWLLSAACIRLKMQLLLSTDSHQSDITFEDVMCTFLRERSQA